MAPKRIQRAPNLERMAMQTSSVKPSPVDTSSVNIFFENLKEGSDKDFKMNPDLHVDLHGIRDDLVTIALKAGEVILAASPLSSTSSTKKNSSDRVTETDKAVEALIHDYLKMHHPEIDFLGEETFDNQLLSDEPTFIVDPIDGTLNFVHGFPNVAVSLCLAVSKKPVVGVVLNIFRHELYTAVKGEGAFLYRNIDFTGMPENPIRLPLNKSPPPLTTLNDTLVAVEWGSERSGPNWNIRHKTVSKLLTSKQEGGAMVHSIRSSGSAALDFCYVASGVVDIFWEGGCWSWDVAGGWIILEEAGGLVASANPGCWEPSLEGRLFCGVRAAEGGKGMKEVVEELWACMDAEFVYPVVKIQ